MKLKKRTGPPGSLTKSRHAAKRQQQRAISDSQVEAVLDWGRVYYQGGGRTAWFIGRKEVRTGRRQGRSLDHAVNIAVVLAADGTVITAIRTANLKLLRRRWS